MMAICWIAVRDVKSGSRSLNRYTNQIFLYIFILKMTVRFSRPKNRGGIKIMNLFSERKNSARSATERSEVKVLLCDLDPVPDSIQIKNPQL